MRFRSEIEALEAYPAAKALPYSVGVMSNENNYGPSPKVLEAVKKSSSEKLLRYPDPFATRLREALSPYNAVPAQNIVCFSGGDEAIHAILGLFLEKGRKLVGHSPTFAMYPIGAQFYGASYDAVKLSQEFSFGEEQAQEIISKIDENSVVALCNPNNPTGNSIPQELLLKIISAAKGKDAPVIVDEAYFEFYGKTVVAKAVEEESNVIVVRTLSKAFGLAGLRVGYAVAPTPVAERLLKSKLFFNVNAMAQEAGIAALGDYAWMRQNAEKIVADREKMFVALKEMGFKVFVSEANFLLFECKKDFVDKLAAKGVLTRGFALKGFGGGSFCRLTVGRSEENEKVLAAIRQIA